MPTLIITIDAPIEADLQRLSESAGYSASEMAARLLARAARPRPVYDIEALKAYAAEFADEDLALAESDITHRADLLAQEDNA